MDIVLSADEQRIWDELVTLGKELRAPKKQALEASRMEGAAGMADTPGRKNKTDPTTWKRRPKGKMKGDSLTEIPDAVKRWVVARAAGMGFKKAADVSVASWNEVALCQHTSEEMRCAMDAMHAKSRMLMKEAAYATVEEIVQGTELGNTVAKTAMEVLERLDKTNFANPKYAPTSTVTGALAAGGITIHLVDTSKPYCPPQVTCAEGEA